MRLQHRRVPDGSSGPRADARRQAIWIAALATAWGGAVGPAGAQDKGAEKPVYRCPGNLYTDTLSAKEAAAKGCKTLEGAPITVLQTPARKAESPTRSSDSKVTTGDQRSRDSDARRILEAELRKEEEALAQLKKDYNNGEPERRGDEKNYQKYQDRTSEMKASISRKEADIEALKREIGKLPAP